MGGVLLMIKDRRVNKSKNALKEALLLLMEQKDFKKITVTDLVNASDLNRGTFYKHYQTKEELLDEIIDDVMEDLVISYREPYIHADKFTINDLTAGTIRIFDHVSAYSNFYTLIINSNVLPGFQNKICDVLKQLSQQDLHTHSLSSRKNINFDLFSSYNAYAIFGLIVEWVKGGFIYSPKYMAEQLLEILTYNNSNNSHTIIDISKRS